MGKAAYSWSEFRKESEVRTAEDLNNYFQHRIAKDDNPCGDNRAFYHECFFHYSRLENIEKIFQNSSFLCTEYGSSNDPLETKMLKKQNHTACSAYASALGRAKIFPCGFCIPVFKATADA